MTNELQIFNNGMKDVRTIVVEGEPWFAIKDACDILDIKNPTMAMKRLDTDEVTKFNLGGLVGETNFVNEYGLYNIILGSRKPEAKAFKRWITHEVIPSIRKHGAYMTLETIEKAVVDPEYMNDLLRDLEAKSNELIKTKRQLALQAPKAVAYDSFLSAKNTFNLTEVGKSLGISGIKLCEYLRDCGVLLKRPKNVPAQKYLEKGYFIVRYFPERKDEYSGEIQSGANFIQHTRVTASGVDFIRAVLRYGLKLDIA
ncbi:BRO family protein [Neobacillus drentensis]|uniref:BRO family protein n=1 Tax=Neobacillus drentensis TaxID=220684 RepID=UPI00300268F4